MTAATPPVAGEKRGVMLAALCAGAFLATVDTSLVSIALPQMGRDLGASLATISWVMMAYLIANAALLLSSSQLGDILAPGRLFLAGMLIFSLASALCGLSSQLWQMMLARACQGAGASLMLGVAPKIITLMYQEGERGLAFGLFSTAFATGISIGAPLGALIMARWGWQWIFFICLPITAGATLATGKLLWRLQAPADWHRRVFNWRGGVLFSLGLSLFLYALTRVRTLGWRDQTIWGALGLAGVIFSMLLLVERRQDMPLLPRVLWRNRAFCLGAVAVVLTFAPVMGTFFLLPFYLEEIFHLPPQGVGWMLATLSFANALVSPVGGVWGDRWSNIYVLRLGAGLIVGGLGTLLWLGPPVSTGVLAVVLATIGIGFGLFQAPNLNEMLLGVKPQILGLAAGTNAVLKNVGALLGIALSVTVITLGEPRAEALQAGQSLSLPCFQRAFALAGALGGINLILSLIPRGRTQS